MNTPSVDYSSSIARRVLIITQHLSVPLDQQVWMQATELSQNGYIVSVICPKGNNNETTYEKLENIHIFRYPLSNDTQNATSHFIQNLSALIWQFMLTGRIFVSIGFDVIHACNPPDTMFLIGGFFKLFFSKKFLFDYRVSYPEYYRARLHQKALSIQMLWSERMSFKIADIVIVASKALYEKAITRGGMQTAKVFIVQPSLHIENIKTQVPVLAYKNSRKYLVTYSGDSVAPSKSDYFIEVARILIQEQNRCDIQFVLMDASSELKRLAKLAALIGITDYFTFVENISSQSVFDIMGTTELAVNFRADSEEEISPSYTAMYSMALGKPILHIKPDDPEHSANEITALLDDPQKRMALGKAGLTQIEKNHAWAMQAPQLLAAYTALFNDGKKHGSLIPE